MISKMTGRSLSWEGAICCMLPRPQPREGAGAEEGVDRAIDARLDGRGPGAPIPDRHLPKRKAVADECGDGHELEDLQVGRSARQGATHDVRGEKPYDDAIDKPKRQRLTHRAGAV